MRDNLLFIKNILLKETFLQFGLSSKELIVAHEYLTSKALPEKKTVISLENNRFFLGLRRLDLIYHSIQIKKILSNDTNEWPIGLDVEMKYRLVKYKIFKMWDSQSGITVPKIIAMNAILR